MRVVSLWKIAIKAQIGKFAMPLDESFYFWQLQALKAQSLAVSLQNSLALMKPLHHRDPFDCWLIAQANEEELTLTTRDAWFSSSYGLLFLQAI